MVQLTSEAVHLVITSSASTPMTIRLSVIILSAIVPVATAVAGGSRHSAPPVRGHNVDLAEPVTDARYLAGRTGRTR